MYLRILGLLSVVNFFIITAKNSNIILNIQYVHSLKRIRIYYIPYANEALKCLKFRQQFTAELTQNCNIVSKFCYIRIRSMSRLVYSHSNLPLLYTKHTYLPVFCDLYSSSIYRGWGNLA